MAPNGVPHFVHPHDEHATSIHPDIRDNVYDDVVGHNGKASRNKLLQAAQQRGHVRFISTLDSHHIHYDKKAPDGPITALHTLRYLKPKLGHRIVVTDKSWKAGSTDQQAPHEHEFTTPGGAYRHIQKQIR